jgi:hypothetical protein
VQQKERAVKVLLAGLLIGLAFANTSARAMDIVAALNASQLEEFSRCTITSDDAPEAKVLQRSFKALQDARAATTSVRLRVADCAHGIQVLAGEVVVPAEVASWDEGERLFVLAHELGHIEHRDWEHLTAAYAESAPRDIAEDDVPRTLSNLRARANQLKRHFEYAADKYAAQLLTRMGRNAQDDAEAALARFWSREDTPTHPGAMQRMAALLLAR